VNSIDDFVTLVRDELGLPLTRADVGRDLDEVPGWDSVRLLSLLTILERATGRPMSFPALLDAQSFAHIYELARTT
jgi:hypothetical protein